MKQKYTVHEYSGLKKLTELFFYGNYFYGFCIVALLLEATIQLKIPFAGCLFYVTAFVATILFYNYPNARNYTSPDTNPRVRWYIRNHSLIIRTQIVLTVLLLSLIFKFVLEYNWAISNIDALQWLLILIFPIAGALYYGVNFYSTKYNLRSIGWLKPFIIGFVWAGIANVYPVLYHDILHAKSYEFTLTGNLLFLKNLMFVSFLAIMFDIKDHVADNKYQINTLVVKYGLRKTIFYVLLPFTLIGLLTFIAYAVSHHFSLLKMLLFMIPFLLLIAAARSLRKRRSLMYYFVVLDGILIAKALFGILAMLV